MLSIKSIITKAMLTFKKVKWLFSRQALQYRDLDLVILDDFFPHTLSAFRISEYNHYLKVFPKSVVYSTAVNFGIVHDPREFPDVRKEYEACYPEFKDRVINFSSARFKSRVAYIVFLNNAYQFVEYLDQHQIPFIFTLYPGGGFYLHDEDSDEKLLKVCSSPFLKKIITTQKISHEYLLGQKSIDSSKVEFIYGGVFPTNFYNESKKIKNRYKIEKDTFDICFVANKYMKKGVDKGYDTFIDVAKHICHHKDIRFHIVGSFNEFDIDVSILEDRITFYGSRRTDFFPDFYSTMDIILSPNVPYVLAPGAFDGFPTGCCLEAALCEVAVFCTDVLSQNIHFTDQKDIVFISTKSSEISELVLAYYSNPEQLYKIAENGRNTFRDVFSLDRQLEPRVKLIQDCLN